MLTNARIAVYIATALALAAAGAAVLGLGTYNAETGMFDPHPFSVGILATWIAGMASNVLAAIAAFRGWGKKE